MAFPTPFGRYLLLQKLASGGMAEIFLAKATGAGGFEKTCVIKRVLPHLAANEAFVRMFLDEARLAARLSHPGIAQIFDLGQVGTDYYLAMEYLPGEDVGEIVDRSNDRQRMVPLDVAARIASAAADALDFAHKLAGEDGRPLGIVHRDISPSNLRVTYLGAVKVLDFGIALAGQRLQTTEVGVIKGKAAYMSPEQARGQPVDCRSDVWSLGVCLHELICGRALFPRGASATTGVAVLTMPIPPPSARRPDVPRELDAIVMTALERDPALRYATAQELSLALHRFLANRTYVPEGQHLGAYLRELFGPERAAAALSRTQALLPSTPGPQTDAAPGPGEATAESLPTDAARRVPWRVGAVALSALVLAAGAWAGVRAFRAPAPIQYSASIASVPSDAAVYLDGERRPERTPVTLERLAPGRYEVRVSKDGFEPRLAELELRPEQPNVSVTLTLAPVPPAPVVAEAPEPVESPPRARAAEPRRAPAARTGLLTVESNLEVEVKLDGVTLGRTPLVRRRVAAGTHALLLEDRSKGLSRSLKVEVKVEAERRETVRFEKGRLNVTTRPWADVYLDGERLGQTPLAGREVWEGRHTLRLTGPDREKTRTIEIRPAQTTVVNEQF